METGLVPVFNPLNAPAPVTRSPDATRGLVRAPEPAAEVVLQGEVVDRQHGRVNWSRTGTERREEHPGFYQRHPGTGYTQRQALAAYESHSQSAGAQVATPPSIDLFV